MHLPVSCIMVSSVILILLIPTALCNVAYNVSKGNVTLEIQKLNALTQQLADSDVRFMNKLQSLQKVKQEDISFYVYNRQNTEPQEVLFKYASQIASVSSFDVDLDTIVLIHGWHNDVNCTFNSIVGEGYLNKRNVNIIIVDWDSFAEGIYLTAYNAVPYVGQYVGQFIQNVSSAYEYSLNKISLVGHSLGAHISGYIGQETNGSLYSITGLDPAGPLFFESSPDQRLSEGDAQYVYAIHTDAGLLGISYSVGLVDFWPNGGSSQPGCSMDVTGTCSHSRSYLLFKETLNSNDFISKQCDSYVDYTAGECTRTMSVVMGGPYVNTTISGNYYLQTNSSSPYALGDTGL